MLDLGQCGRHIRVFHEAEGEQHLEHPGLDLGDLVAVVGVDARRIVGVDRHDEGGRVQHFVVAQVVHQRGRRLAEVFEHEHGGSGDSFDVGGLVERLDDGPFAAVDAFGHQLATTTPRLHLHIQDDGHGEGEPATAGDLHQIGADEPGLDDQQRHAHQVRLPIGPVPAVDQHLEEDERGDGHGHRDRDAVGRGEIRRGAEAEHQADAGHHQQPVHQRHVDLTHVLMAGVADLDTRQVVELHRLSGEREHA